MKCARRTCPAPAPQVACPRLSIDWGEEFAVPTLNSYEVGAGGALRVLCAVLAGRMGLLPGADGGPAAGPAPPADAARRWRQ